jgi:hypothetical protein
VRLNVYLPDELTDALRAELPDLNVSRALQEALRSLLTCAHGDLCCQRCSKPLYRQDVAEEALSAFYVDVWDRLDLLVRKVGTAEGAARILRDVAVRHGVATAGWRPLPRPTRGERQLALDLEHERAS